MFDNILDNPQMEEIECDFKWQVEAITNILKIMRKAIFMWNLK